MQPIAYYLQGLTFWQWIGIIIVIGEVFSGANFVYEIIKGD